MCHGYMQKNTDINSFHCSNYSLCRKFCGFNFRGSRVHTNIILFLHIHYSEMCMCSSLYGTVYTVSKSASLVLDCMRYTLWVCVCVHVSIYILYSWKYWWHWNSAILSKMKQNWYQWILVWQFYWSITVIAIRVFIVHPWNLIWWFTHKSANPPNLIPQQYFQLYSYMTNYYLHVLLVLFQAEFIVLSHWESNKDVFILGGTDNIQVLVDNSTEHVCNDRLELLILYCVHV